MDGGADEEAVTPTAFPSSSLLTRSAPAANWLLGLHPD